MYRIVYYNTNIRVEGTNDYNSLYFAKSILAELLFQTIDDSISEEEKNQLARKEFKKYELIEI